MIAVQVRTFEVIGPGFGKGLGRCVVGIDTYVVNPLSLRSIGKFIARK